MAGLQELSGSVVAKGVGLGRSAMVSRSDCAAPFLGWSWLLLVLLVCGCVSSDRPLPDFESTSRTETQVTVYDPTGSKTDQKIVGAQPTMVGAPRGRPWDAAAKQGNPKGATAGAGKEGAASPGQGEQAAPPAQDDSQDYAEEDLYARFGSRIVIHPDGRISKTYWLDQDTGAVFDKLLEMSSAKTPVKPPAKGQPPQKSYNLAYKFGTRKGAVPSVLDTLLEGYEYVIQRVPKFDTFRTRLLDPDRFNGSMANPSTPVENDLLLVTSSADGLESFEQAMDLFYKSVPQILIEARVVEVDYGDSLDLGVSQVDPKTPTVRTLNSGNFIKSLTSVFPNSTGLSNSPTLSKGLLSLGGIQDNIEVNAVLELLQQRAKADIVSHPRIAVRNGGMASIVTQREIPYPSAQIIGVNTRTSIKFKNVGITMEIYPTVAPGETVLLQIFANISEVTGFVETVPIPTPQVALRKAVTSVLVPKGKTTIIGGLKTRSRFENESMVPLLGDIPILGYLFRSTNVQTQYSEVLFMITPRIIYGFEGVEVEDDLGNDG